MQDSARVAADEVQSFSAVLNSTNFHGNFPADVAALKSQTAKVIADYRHLAQAPSVGTYLAYAQGQLEADAEALDATFNTLNHELLDSIGQG